MSDAHDPRWLTTHCNYVLIATVQITVAIVGMKIHRNIKLPTCRLQQRFSAHSKALAYFAMVMAVAEMYMSILVASFNGPTIVIPWLFIAQSLVTLLFLYLPFEHSDLIAEEQAKEEEISLLAMEDAETLVDEDEDEFDY
ncbi:hypothetical protein FLONG3_3960 [Fusarium longipes]|uniref:Uncharacterized protein n=1 Tax=Fusarium longipes TaxID=694270 RepID=A0A395SZI1_9HYPO|nr:hypothetical protein FLONG3_3960 [Fusarium longipes]